jgi:type IV pilus assembly protein PilA
MNPSPSHAVPATKPARPIERRRRDSEEGFTLVELLVVLLIIAILVAILIPTFVGASHRAQNRAAQSVVRSALTVEKTSYTDNQAFTATSATLTAIEPSLTYVATLPGAGTHEVYVAVATTSAANDTVVLGAQSADGNCYWVQDVASGASAGTQWSTITTCSVPAGATFTSSAPPTG